MTTRVPAQAAGDLFAFLIFFMIVFFGFATMGHLLFGPTVYDFRTIFTSLMTCFRFILVRCCFSGCATRKRGWAGRRT